MNEKDNPKCLPSEKDFEKMADLLNKKSNGIGIAKALKNKDKVINRWVAGVLLRVGPEEDYPECIFRAFYNRALELGATNEELKDRFKKAGQVFNKDNYKDLRREFPNYIDYALSKKGFHVEEETQSVMSRNKHESRSDSKRNIRTLVKVYDNKGHYVFIDYDNVMDEGDFSRWHNNSIYELFGIDADNPNLLKNCLIMYGISDNQYKDGRIYRSGGKFKMRPIAVALENYFKKVSA